MLLHDLASFPVLDDNGGFAGTISYRNIQKSILELYSEYQDE
jgi:hypothetical protein